MSASGGGDDVLAGRTVSRRVFTGVRMALVHATVVQGPITTPKRKSPVLIVLSEDRQLAVWEIEGNCTITVEPDADDGD